MANKGVAGTTRCRAGRQDAASRQASSRLLRCAPALRVTRPNVLTHRVFMAGSELPATSRPICENTSSPEVNPHILCSPFIRGFSQPPTRGAHAYRYRPLRRASSRVRLKSCSRTSTKPAVLAALAKVLRTVAYVTGASRPVVKGHSLIRGRSVRMASAAAGRSCSRHPVFVAGSVRRSVARSRCSHRMARISPIRWPVTAARRIAATCAGCRSSQRLSASARAQCSVGENVRSRASSRALDSACRVRVLRTPLPRLEQREQPRDKCQHTVPLHLWCGGG